MKYVVAFLTLLALPTASSKGVKHGGGNCTTDWDCSLGGLCVDAECSCDRWFTGPNCVLLNLQRANFPGDGMDYRTQNYYSWGGHCIKDKGLYHGYFSFMCRHATLDSWTTASSVVHATADKPTGPYHFKEMVIQPWSHNAIVQKDPLTGQFLIFHIGDAKVNSSQWAPCFNGSADTLELRAEASSAHALMFQDTPPRHDERTLHSSVGSGDGDGIYVSTAPTPDGPWTPFNGGKSLMFNLSGWWASGVSNPTPYIFPNGTTLMMVTGFPCPPGWGNLAPPCIGMLQADHWSGPYEPLHSEPIVHPESEDPFIWKDPRGNFHLHTNVNTYHKRCPVGVACGGHAWSHDAINWSDQYIGAFGPVLTTNNGSVVVNAYVERPQVYQDEVSGVPLVFFTGMAVKEYRDTVSWAQAFCGEDMDPVNDCGPTVQEFLTEVLV